MHSLERSTQDRLERRTQGRFVDTLHRVLVHGMPAPQAEATLASWSDHLEMHDAEHGHGHAPLKRFALLGTSGCAHLKWRLLHGPASGILPGLFLVLAGLGALLFAISTTNALDPTGSAVRAFACLALGMHYVRHPRLDSPRWFGLWSMLLAASLCRYLWFGSNDIRRLADLLILTAVVGIIAGLGLTSYGVGKATSRGRQLRNMGFSVMSAGGILVAIADYEWIFQQRDITYNTALAVSTVACFMIAATIWRLREIEHPIDSSENQDQRSTVRR